MSAADAGQHITRRLRERGVPMNAKVDGFIHHMIAAGTEHASASESVRAGGWNESTARAWCSKKRLPRARSWHQLGRALRIAEAIQAGGTVTGVAARFGYTDHSGVSTLMRRTFGMGASGVRDADPVALLDGWLEREVGA